TGRAVVLDDEPLAVAPGPAGTPRGDGASEGVEVLGGAAVWGLVRSAQAEHPGRMVLVDTDAPEDLDGVLRAVATGEPQLAVRSGHMRVPRLVRAAADPEQSDAPVLDVSGTVVVTGGTGVLGGLVARHLVVGYGV